MEIPVLVEPMNGDGFRATGPFDLMTEGKSHDEALANLRELIARRLGGGGKFTQLSVGPSDPSWVRFLGAWKKDDPLIKEWKKAVATYRKGRDRKRVRS